MAISRKIYTAGIAHIKWTQDPQGVTFTHTENTDVIAGSSLVIQSLDWSRDIPKETITAFGTSAFSRVSNEATSVELEMELYPTAGIGARIKLMAVETLKETPDRMNIYTSAGHCVHALMSSCEFEASVGDVPTMSLSFQGQADTSILNCTAAVAATLGALSNVGTTSTIAAGIRHVAGAAVNSGGTYGCVTTAIFNTVFPQSFSASWDGGVETIARLKDNIDIVYAFGNPPGEASIECEGLSTPGTVQFLNLYTKDDAAGSSTGPLAIGLAFNGGLGDLSSESVSNAVGELFQTFSTTTEGTAVGTTFS